MPETRPSESAMLDMKNTELAKQLYTSKDIQEIISTLEKLHDCQIANTNGMDMIQAFPTIPEIVFFQSNSQDLVSNPLESDLSIRFSEKGVVTLSEKGSSVRTKYNPTTGEVFRSDTTLPKIPRQLLPRHAKHHFLTRILQAQEIISQLVQSQLVP